MKLIFCKECYDIVLLRFEERTCGCGESSGKYMEDGLNATISGPCVPVGFANNSFLQAIKEQPAYGMGRRFEAFVIPAVCTTVSKKEREEDGVHPTGDV